MYVCEKGKFIYVRNTTFNFENLLRRKTIDYKFTWALPVKLWYMEQH